MKPQLFFSLLVLLTVLSCSRHSSSEDNVPIICFDEFSDIHSAETMITSFLKLSTTDNCLISSLSQLISTKDLLLIADGKKVLVFDKKGSFITQIGQKGEGPGEYLYPVSFFIQEEENIIHIIDMNNKVLRFSLNTFQFISEKKMAFASSYASFLPDGNIIWTNRGYLSKEIHSESYFLVTDTNFTVLNNFVDKEFKSGYTTGDQNNIYNIGKQLFIYTPFSPVIYQASTDSLFPVFKLSVEKRKFPPTDFLQEITADGMPYFPKLENSDYISHFGLRENTHDVCVFYIAKGERFIGLYDKVKKQTYHYRISDFQQWLNIGAGFTYVVSGMLDDYHVIPLTPSELKEQKRNGYQFPMSLDSLIDKSREDDNPILCLFKIKTI
ncbi:MAG: 6-bladed beta-propeller [Prevotellaceae bacterium]|jgi:hypothetical protein|nr:6-bladed beta-propeller [Prevotellaceae bacterium]